ncbi:MAG: tRNA-dihydrouridine synthase family protein, partial [Candidatus Heimdallarchaeota archaeon]
MKLGSLNLKNNLLLAPLQEVTTAPYRRFCRNFCNIGLVCVPMIYTKRIQTNPESILFDLHKIEKERPISVQLIGADPNALKNSIDFLESYKFDVLDINAGCPSKRAIKAKEGGYLLNDLIKLNQLIKVATKYSSRPVSLKIRIGVEKPNNIKDMANLINKSGLEFLIVHGRTVKDRFNNSQLHLKYIKQLKERVSIPIIGNGDIYGQDSAKEFLDNTDVDALMIGRGSMGNPEIFNQIDDYLNKGVKTKNENNVRNLKKYIELYEKIFDEFIEGNRFLRLSSVEYKF